MMHCTMEDLGALRAGEASVSARRHITTCTQCQAELEALYQRVAQLKALPALRPPRDRWPAIHAALRVERSRRRRTWGTWTGSLALAATITAVLLVQPGQQGTLYAELSQAKQQSATLEDSLQQYDIDGRVLSGHAAAGGPDRARDRRTRRRSADPGYPPSNGLRRRREERGTPRRRGGAEGPRGRAHPQPTRSTPHAAPTQPTPRPHHTGPQKPAQPPP